MLLFIALANSHYFLQATRSSAATRKEVSTVDSVSTWLIATFVDGRAFPMFGLLFGYGVAQIVRRQADLAPKVVRRLLWRRSLVLVVVGFLHAVLLYVGDILAAYGVLLFLGVWAVRWKDRWLLAVAALFLVLGALPSEDSLSVSSEPPRISMLPPDLLTMISERAVVSPLIAVLAPIGFACPFLVGLWAGRRRILEQPERHRRLLLVTAVAGIGIAVLGAQPVSLVLSGVLPVPGQRHDLDDRSVARLCRRARWDGVCRAHRLGGPQDRCARGPGSSTRSRPSASGR